MHLAFITPAGEQLQAAIQLQLRKAMGNSSGSGSGGGGGKEGWSAPCLLVPRSELHESSTTFQDSQFSPGRSRCGAPPGLGPPQPQGTLPAPHTSYDCTEHECKGAMTVSGLRTPHCLLRPATHGSCGGYAAARSACLTIIGSGKPRSQPAAAPLLQRSASERQAGLCASLAFLPDLRHHVGADLGIASPGASCRAGAAAAATAAPQAHCGSRALQPAARRLAAWPGA